MAEIATGNVINNRYIDIEVKEDDTLISKILVGYYYPDQKFFVTNKNTTTTRNTAEQILKVMLVLLGKVEIETPKGNIDLTDLDNPEKLEINARKLEQLIKNTTETLGTPITCTLEDNGSYIRTLQFNDWIDYPLAVDCEKGNIYIKNTNIVYPLDLDESPDTRVARFCSYYLETLGLEIKTEIMLQAYNLLANQYNEPSFYNLLSKDSVTNNLSYTNTFRMNNYTDVSAITCEGTRNPNGETVNKEIGNTLNIDNVNGVIYLEVPINKENKDKFLSPGFKVAVEGASYEEDGTTYSADGTYTINQLLIDEDETSPNYEKVTAIQVEEPIPSSYEYPYPTCYVQSLECPIFSMERENRIIKVEKLPQDLLVGDIIHVKDATIGEKDTVNYVSLDGPYTVQSISNQVKQIVDKVIDMHDTVIAIDTSETQLQIGDTLQIQGTESENDNYLYTIKDIPEGTVPTSTTTIAVSETIPKYYGEITENDIQVGFRHTTATNIIDLPVAFQDIVINKGDLVDISGISTAPQTDTNTNYSPNNKLYTILNVVRNGDISSVSIDSEVIPTPEGQTVQANAKITPMTSATLTSSTTLYYNIYTEEDIVTDYIPGPTQHPKFYKEVFISDIEDIQTIQTVVETETKPVSKLTLKDAYSGFTPHDTTVYIHNQGESETATVIAYDSIGDKRIVDLNILLKKGMPEKPKVYNVQPDSTISLDATAVQGYLADTVPVGEFILDDFSQCQAYVASIHDLDEKISAKESKVPELPIEIDERMYSELKENDKITDIEDEDIEVTFKGLYSEVYPNQDTL